VTIGTLPDDVLLKIFKTLVAVAESFSYYATSDKWPVLVHICQRWRKLAFTFPRHLNLQILFNPPSRKRSVKRMLDIWPDLPIYIHVSDFSTKEKRDDIVAALRLNHRVCGIHLRFHPDSAWETCGPWMNHPFPALTDCRVELSCYLPVKNAISCSFLGGSAPSLRVLHLDCVPLPTLPNLLLSATNLVSLRYEVISTAGYISPQEMVAGLSALTRLETLSLAFRSPKSLLDRASRIPPLHMRRFPLLPALTYLRFWGAPEYMEDLVAQIDARSLEKLDILFSHQEVLEVSELAKFVGRADKLSLVHRAKVIVSRYSTSVELSPAQEWPKWVLGKKTFVIRSTFLEPVPRLSYLAQFCASFLPTPSPFERLDIHLPADRVQDARHDPDPQWLELLRPFSTVKLLWLDDPVAPHVGRALGSLPAERVLGVLPALEAVFLPRECFESMKEAISKFAHARQLSGHPVLICDFDERELCGSTALSANEESMYLPARERELNECCWNSTCICTIM
jgi:hypothetical protein